GDRRDHGVDPGTVWQAGVDERARLVDTATHAPDDLVDGPAEVGVRGEARLDREYLSRPLDVDAGRAVDHDFRDLRVAEQRLDRPVTQDLVGYLLGDSGAVGQCERRLLGVDNRLQRLPDPGLEVGGREVWVVQLGPQLVDHRLMDPSLDLGQRVDHGRQHPELAVGHRGDRLLRPSDAVESFGKAHRRFPLLRVRKLARVSRRPFGSAGGRMYWSTSWRRA